MGLMSLVGMDKIFNFLGSITSGILKLFTQMTAILLAIKTMIFTSITVTLLTMLYNLFVYIMTSFWNWIYAEIASNQGSMDSVTYQFTGLGAYLFQHLKIGESLALIFIGVSIRFIIKMIPFIG